MALHEFQPPVRYELPRILAKPRKDDRFWLRIQRGIRVAPAVLKQPDGSYLSIEDPSQSQIDASVVTYLGGHIYYVDDAEAASLQAAGFTVG